VERSWVVGVAAIPPLIWLFRDRSTLIAEFATETRPLCSRNENSKGEFCSRFLSNRPGEKRWKRRDAASTLGISRATALG